MKFELYFKPQCPYCLKVLNFLHEEGIHDYVSYNIEDGISGPENKKNLEAHGGKVQVAYLVKEDGTGMYESDDIIEYIKENI